MTSLLPCCRRWVVKEQAYPTTTTKCTSDMCLSMLWEQWCSKLTCPVQLHSGNDMRFTSDIGFWKGILTSLGVKVDFSTPKRPQSNELVERTNGSILSLLRILMLELQTKDWPKLQWLALWCLNNMPSV